MSKESSENSPFTRVLKALRGKSTLRKVSIWLSAIGLVCALLLVALPIVSARVATSWLQNNGAANATIENIDINLFTGKVRLVGLEAGGSAQQRLHIGEAEVDIRWWPLASKHILVEAIRLSESQIDIAPDGQGGWQVGGLRLSPAVAAEPEIEDASEESVFSWGIGSEAIALTNVSVTYRDGMFDTDVDVREIAIGSTYSWVAGETTELVVDMDVNGAPITLRSDVVPWGEEQRFSGVLNVRDHALDDHGQALQSLAGLEDLRGSLSMNLEVTAALDAAGVLDVMISGPLDLTGVGFNYDSLAFSNEQLAWQGTVALQLDAAGVLTVALTGPLVLSTVSLNDDSLSLSNEQLDWQGAVALKLPAAAGEPMVTVDGALQLAGTGVALADLEIDAGLGAFDFTGRFDLLAAADDQAPAGLALTAALTGQGLAVDHARLPFELARLDSFTVSDIIVSDISRATAGQLQLQGLRLLAGEQEGETTTVFSLDQLDVAQAGYDAADGVTIESVTLGEPVISVVRDANGDIDRITELLAVFAGETPEVPAGEAAPQAQTTAPLTFKINNVQVTSTNLIAIEDLAVTPPVNFRLTGLDLNISNIDSSSANPMAVQLATNNDNMELSVDGSMAVFAEPRAINLMVSLSSLELPRFSAYIPGYNIDRGRLTTNSTIVITGDTLDAQNSVLLEQIMLASKSAEGNEIVAQGMAMPLDVALDLLRDSDDRIELDLPITGSLSDPKFDSTDILRTVMQNALQNAAMSYVTNALQPLGTLLMLGGLASQAAAPRFAPLEMAAGESALVAEGREYLLKIGDLLTERPSLQLFLCGIVTEADRQALAAVALDALSEVDAAAAPAEASDPAADVVPAEPVAPQISDSDLLQLAARRTGSATDFLTDEAGIDAGRLFSCRETIDTAEDAIPRVRISL